MMIVVSIGNDSVDIEVPDDAKPLLMNDVLWMMYLKPAISVLIDNL